MSTFNGFSMKLFTALFLGLLSMHAQAFRHENCIINDLTIFGRPHMNKIVETNFKDEAKRLLLERGFTIDPKFKEGMRVAIYQDVESYCALTNTYHYPEIVSKIRITQKTKDERKIKRKEFEESVFEDDKSFTDNNEEASIKWILRKIPECRIRK